MNALSLTGLSKTYDNGVEALKGIDLTVEEGDFFALLGPNGAGKTTAIGIVTSLVKKTAGTVEVFGHDLDRHTERAKSCIGLVPQEVNFNQFEKPLEILINQAGFYGLSPQLARERAETHLRQLQLWGKRDDIARNLSGGMKRRLMIARALVHQPPLLILDEPTAGVDIEIRRSMWEFMQRINADGTTIILTTHYLEEAESLCRNVAIIDSGRIVEHDRMSRVLRKLHFETFVLDVEAKLPATISAEGFTIRRVNDYSLEVDKPQQQSINELFSQLTSQGIHISSMRNKANRLEELFLRMVENKAEQT
ncbi:MAG: ABC transporter ATP-binding protein [Gammaproteobacteria bacterium]|nr:ABC transporter ATP-binding protein [Gammaproteobacteria bacterium]NNF60854.1 ABC transporter ATP-binding protein [Gammaproteobacteria bacterium]